MAEDRVDRIRRILKVQQQLHRAEEWRLSEIEQRIASLEADQRDLIAALNAENGLEGLFLDATVRRVKSLAESARVAEGERAEQAGRVLETGSRLKAAERLLQRAEAHARREEEAADLREIMDRLASQAPRKIIG
ncbi:MAG: hypothetical protein NW223_09455 [Hyphomicrobiaceae bacterium]|nr:hypothetical protein [Hyphomicrobiaceae bacterium]